MTLLSNIYIVITFYVELQLWLIIPLIQSYIHFLFFDHFNLNKNNKQSAVLKIIRHDSSLIYIVKLRKPCWKYWQWENSSLLAIHIFPADLIKSAYCHLLFHRHYFPYLVLIFFGINLCPSALVLWSGKMRDLETRLFVV